MVTTSVVPADCLFQVVLLLLGLVLYPYSSEIWKKKIKIIHIKYPNWDQFTCVIDQTWQRHQELQPDDAEQHVGVHLHR